MQYDRLEYASSPISPYATCAPYSSSGEELPARHESGSEYSVQNSATSPARAANAAIPDGNRTSSDSAAVASMSRNTSPSTLSATARSRACATHERVQTLRHDRQLQPSATHGIRPVLQIDPQRKIIHDPLLPQDRHTRPPPTTQSSRPRDGRTGHDVYKNKKSG